MQFFSFIGRQLELQQLSNSLNDSSLVLVLGKAGVGKTSLCTQFIKSNNIENVHRYHCNRDQSVNDLTSDLIKLLQDLPLETIDLEIHIKSFIGILNRQKSLLIIDDFENVLDENSKLFLSSLHNTLTQSKVIIISNATPKIDPFELLDIYQIKLNLLSTTDTEQLSKNFLNRSGVDDKVNYEMLYKKLNGHPLFIKYFFSLICNGRASINELTQENSKIDSYINTYIFKEIWSKLNSNEQLILQVLSLLEISITMSRLITILGASLDRNIQTLVDNFLVESEPRGEIYLHNFLKSYIKKNHPIGDRSIHYDIARSFSKPKTFFISDLTYTCHHYLKGNYIKEFVDTILDITEFVLLSFIEMDDLIVLIDRNLYAEEGKYFEELLEAKIKLLITKSNIPEALSLMEQIKNDQGSARINIFLLYHQGRYQETLDAIEHYLSSYINVSNLQSMNLNLYMCVSFFRLDMREESAPYLKKSLELFADNSFIKAAIYRYIFMGFLPLDLHLSIQYLSDAEEILSENYPHSALYATVLFDQSTVEFKYFNNTPKALEVIRKSKQIYKELFVSQKYVQASLVEAGVLLRNLDLDMAESIVLDLRKNLNVDPFTSAKIDMMHGGIYLVKNDLENAGKFYEKGFQDIEKLSIASRQFYLMFLRYLIASSQFERALEFCKYSGFTKWFTGYAEDEAEKYHYMAKVNALLQNFDRVKELESKKVENLSTLSDYSKTKVNKSIAWYQTNVLNHTIPKYKKITNLGTSIVALEEVQDIKYQHRDWDMVIDFSEEKCFIHGSEVNLVSKGKLFQLLKVLALNDGQEICSRDLYQRCWKSDYNPDIDGALKTNINRLRKLIKEHLDEQFIISPQRGVYALHKKVNYCFLEQSN